LCQTDQKEVLHALVLFNALLFFDRASLPTVLGHIRDFSGYESLFFELENLIFEYGFLKK
jgi:hypothetical protein